MAFYRLTLECVDKAFIIAGGLKAGAREQMSRQLPDGARVVEEGFNYLVFEFEHESENFDLERKWFSRQALKAGRKMGINFKLEKIAVLRPELKEEKKK